MGRHSTRRAKKEKKNEVENVKPYNDKKRELPMRKNVVKIELDTAFIMGLISILEEHCFFSQI